jgi:hypothetical protein
MKTMSRVRFEGLHLGIKESWSTLVVDVFIPGAFAALCEPMASAVMRRIGKKE